ncbi:MAG: DUF3072 domain-containing protein [Lachnospiraceae bacterium]|nr:DUF3072 domain-containing protein [Lachnospiraceae bacterium]
MDMELLREMGILATESQKDYIETLLDQAEYTLEEYTDTPLDELTKEEASDLIDELKGDLGYD